MRWACLILAGAAWLALGLPDSTTAWAQDADIAAHPTDLSAQNRRQARRPRARTRITVRPLPRDLSDYRRLCEPVFEERWIPQWGGSVLYASQRCRWVRL